MAYYPKNLITTNLYTSNGEYVSKSTGVAYTGYYWKKFDGTFWTGKTPNDLPSDELINPTSLTSPNTNSFPAIPEISNSNISDTDLDPYFLENMVSIINLPIANITSEQQNLSISRASQYNSIKNIETNDIKKIPVNTIVLPTENDYKLGSYTRYMLLKVNDPIFLEVTKEVYDKILNNDLEYFWQYYKTFTIPWTLTGDIDQVININRNILALTETRLNTTGLQEYFAYDYSQYYKNS